jgi:hypothetical protein
MENKFCIDDKVSFETKNCMSRNFNSYIPEILDLIGEYATEMLIVETKKCFKYGYYMRSSHDESAKPHNKNKFILHRENDEPAIIYKNGDKEWFYHGELHRNTFDKNGKLLPAIIYISENPKGKFFQTEEYWKYGKYINSSTGNKIK